MDQIYGSVVLDEYILLKIDLVSSANSDICKRRE